MNIYFTFDYELVLGRNVGTVESCLIEPTKAYIDLFKKYDISATFFIDCAYLLRLKELSLQHDDLADDYNSIVDNICLLCTNGHSVQYHFHPQWLYSNYEDGEWNLDFEHYKMSDMEEAYLQKTFEEGLALLKSITGKCVIAFRAGGYSLMSYEKYIDLFRKHGLRIDSSVTSGKRNIKLHKYDYTKAPKITHWQFNYDLLTPVVDGFFHEYRIKGIGPYNSWRYLLLKRELDKKHKPTHFYNDGISGANKLARCKELFFKLFTSHSFQACVDGMMAANLINIYNQTFFDNDMVIIGHPKCTTDASLVLTEQFIQHVKKDGCVFRRLDESLLDI